MTRPPHQALFARRFEAVLLAVAFAVAHTQSPLYYSNQNQYLLHGAALGGHGRLGADWLANTADPTPVFSVLVAAAFATQPWLLQPAYFALLMGYFLSVRALVAALPWFPDTRASRVGFAALFTAAHAAILRWASVELAGVDYPWYFQSGLAAQYLLGPGIQPSAFGVLLVSALAAFAHGRATLSCVLAAFSCWFHSTYLLPAGLLVGGFVFALWREGKGKEGVRGGGVALGVVAPVVAYTLCRFGPFGQAAAESIHLLANVRIPHHCVPARWFDLIAGLQLGWVALGLILLRRAPAGSALAVAALGGLLLTLVQLATRSDSLALSFPWRVSVLLVPVATATVIARLLAWIPQGRWPELAAFLALVALAAGGAVVTGWGLGYRTVDEAGVYGYVARTHQKDDVYLIPAGFPKVGTGRGAVSNTFQPPPRAKEGTNQIPVDFQRFRLATGAPVYVDFKSVPYAAAEVKEWHTRMAFAAEFYSQTGRSGLSDLIALESRGITHVVAPRSRPFEGLHLEESYRDDAFILYRVARR